MTVLFTVCLITSNLFATKLIAIGGITLTGAEVIFPVSYILNDCFAEVWGYRKARFVTWIAFAMNFFVVMLGQIVVWIPSDPIWDGGEHFNYMFNMVPRITFASLMAFLTGSTMNAFVMSKMKVLSGGRYFSARAILSSVAGESVDSLVFMPIAFWGTPISVLAKLMFFQVTYKVAYEILILPLTKVVVRKLKKYEGEDVYDNGISYNPFRIFDL